jgi:KUP system potassium uptake protein
MHDDQSLDPSEKNPEQTVTSEPDANEIPPASGVENYPAVERRREPRDAEHSHHDAGMAAMIVGALGVVFGDIGTSPLYAMKESFLHQTPTEPHVFGILSLIVWALVLVISVKYVFLLLKADHNGEGGILALVSRVTQSRASTKTWFPIVIIFGLFGTALLYGDGMITPAISVLSAVEGLEEISPVLKQHVLPITVGILTGLFLFQSQGTERVGKVFGPVMLAWFSTLAGLGLYNLVKVPRILWALSPHYGVDFLWHNGWHGFLVLGAVFLVATGGEAMFADMGHFGRKPIQYAWFGLVFPCLVLNYLGQGALIISNPDAAANPFFRMIPPPLKIWIVLLATISTVVASQALITGAFSLTMQAIRSTYLPRLTVKQTSDSEQGQIYVGAINWILMIGCILLVVGFRSSTNLAAAYGLGVNFDMLIATCMFFLVTLFCWNWSIFKSLAVCIPLLAFELSFLLANSTKILSGGWFAISVGAIVFSIMMTWNQGRKIIGKELMSRSISMDSLLERLSAEHITRVPGTAVFMYSNPEGVPPALLSNLRHNKILHERVIKLSVEIADIAHLPQNLQPAITKVSPGFYRVVIRFGYRDELCVPTVLSRCELDGVPLDVSTCTFFLGRETVIPTSRKRMALFFWQEYLFAFMSRNATDASSFFELPADQVVELGTQVEV